MPIARGLAASLAVAVIGLVAARRWVDAVEVRGSSMAPALLPGDRLLVVRRRGPIRRGDVVLALDPRDAARELVKRVDAVTDAGVVLRGDHAALSTDARTFGALPASAVTWRAVLRYWPPGRVGQIPAAAASEGG
ncbi:MAG TPA: S26 family signal peptidase [Candidatus Limnocylindria bacterium]|jgi:nickel-type superoxide dismutase maturation protease